MKVLKLDIAGNPSRWIGPRQAISLVASGHGLAGLGETEVTYFGGVNAVTQKRSSITVNSILLTTEHVDSRRQRKDYLPPLTNALLFERDGHLCLYCGGRYGKSELSRDHVVPVSQGGADVWTNVVTACKRCNHAKANRTPEQWGRKLLAVPFAPNWAESLFLENRHRIIADQQQFLMTRFSGKARL